MQKAVSVRVSAIDTDWGFTLIAACDRAAQDTPDIAFLSLSQDVNTGKLIVQVDKSDAHKVDFRIR
jgi:hypothetical protein